jgi:hypothetical protein
VVNATSPDTGEMLPYGKGRAAASRIGEFACRRAGGRHRIVITQPARDWGFEAVKELAAAARFG